MTHVIQKRLVGEDERETITEDEFIERLTGAYRDPKEVLAGMIEVNRAEFLVRTPYSHYRVFIPPDAKEPIDA